MTDRAFIGRRRFEQGCRAAAITLLGIAAATLWRGRVGSKAVPAPVVLTIAAADSLRALRDLVARRETDGDDSLRVPVRTVPSAPVRAALGTLARSRVAGIVTWRDASGARGAAMAVEREGGPQGGVQVRLSLPDASETIQLRDAGGVLDSSGVEVMRDVRTRQWRVASTGERLAVQLTGATLRALMASPRGGTPDRVLVVAEPGWESKFVIAALEERGWRVDARLAVTPKAAVTVGTPATPDRSRHVVVVVLDSVGVPPRLGDFIRGGGGVVFSGDGVRSPFARALMRNIPTGIEPAVPGALLTANPLQGLARWRVDIRDAVPLQGGTRADAVQAVRVGAGRVVVSGYRNTWQWRMMGTDQGRTDHARWWDALARAAVPVVMVPVGPVDPAPGDAAPYADLVAQLGRASAAASSDGITQSAASETPASRGWPVPLHWLPWLVGFALGALLLEWGSRRLRGEP